jgi:hypothetical protein
MVADQAVDVVGEQDRAVRHLHGLVDGGLVQRGFLEHHGRIAQVGSGRLCVRHGGRGLLRERRRCHDPEQAGTKQCGRPRRAGGGEAACGRVGCRHAVLTGVSKA